MRAYASLRRQAEFARLRQRGRRIATGNLTIFRADPLRHDCASVVGITVAKPVGTAVVRNRVRRRVAAILQAALPGRRLRLLVIAKPSAAEATFAQLRTEITQALI
jgi:ribonuclease P protein component